jgi:Zn-dependent protease with chaperone function
MNKSIYITCAIVITFLSISIATLTPLKNMVENYAISNLYESCGKKPVSSNIEEKITGIAQKMALSEKIVICKMNVQSMQIWGYYNAFACYPSLFFGLITFNKPHLFISEGFFEDLLPEEQLFIIGHELAHIQQHHLVHFTLFMALIELLFLVLWWFVLVRYIKKFVTRFKLRYQKKLMYVLSIISLFLCLLISGLIELSYQRQHEREADHKALQILKCHNGALSVIERWCNDFKIPLINNYGGIFSDHPSSLERKNYCLTCMHEGQHHEQS